MKYIWENYNSNNYYYIPQYKQSYYEEIWKNCDQYIPVNIYNRFMDVFFSESLTDEKNRLLELDDKYKNDGKYRDTVNMALHQLIFFDRIRGITLDEIKMSIMYDEIMKGYFGTDLKKKMEELEFVDLYIILREYIKTTIFTDTVFDEVLHLLFGKVIIYHEKSTDKTMVYIEKTRNAYREKLYFVVQFLFADMGLNLEVIWANEHFGIIGKSSTMEIDKMIIY